MRVTDEKLEIAIGRMLQAGVLLAAAVVLTGRSALSAPRVGGSSGLQPLSWRGGWICGLLRESGMGCYMAMRRA